MLARSQDRGWRRIGQLDDSGGLGPDHLDERCALLCGPGSLACLTGGAPALYVLELPAQPRLPDTGLTVDQHNTASPGRSIGQHPA